MSKEIETKEQLTKQASKLKKDMEGFKADRNIDKDAKKIVVNVLDKAIKSVEEKLAKMPVSA